MLQNQLHTFGQDTNPKDLLENWVKTWQPILMPMIFIGAMEPMKNMIACAKTR